MSLPITKRVMTAGSRKGCGCAAGCNCGKTPAKKALVGNQDQLPQQLQNAIKAAPGKMYNSPTKQLSKVKEGLSTAGEGAFNAAKDLAQGVTNAATSALNYARENAGNIIGTAVAGPFGGHVGSNLDKKYKNRSNNSNSNQEPKKLVGIRTAQPQDIKKANMTKTIKPVRKKQKPVAGGLKPKGITNPTGAGKMWGAAKVAHGKKKSPAKMGCGSKRK